MAGDEMSTMGGGGGVTNFSPDISGTFSLDIYQGEVKND